MRKIKVALAHQKSPTKKPHINNIYPAAPPTDKQVTITIMDASDFIDWYNKQIDKSGAHAAPQFKLKKLKRNAVIVDDDGDDNNDKEMIAVFWWLVTVLVFIWLRA